MSELIKVVLDTLGGDNSPQAQVEGACLALKEKEDLFIYLTGPKDKIESELSKYDYPRDRVEIVATTEEITTHDHPVDSIRRKKDSSLVVGLNLVKEGKADGIVSSGNTGSVLVGGQTIVGRLKGVERAPLAPVIPNINGVSILIDCGANVDAKPANLVQFAKMGYVYMRDVVGIENPRVAIVNIGVEEEKGNALVKATYPLLKECKDINFIGSIEAREIPFGGADVIVCEAFVGNVILKHTEGLAKALFTEIKKGMTATPLTSLGALLVKPGIKKTLKAFDATEYGGAPLLGLNGLVVKTHGNVSCKEVKNALFQVATFKEQKINETIKKLMTEE